MSEEKYMERRKSSLPILPAKKVFAKRMFVFPMEYADTNINGQKGMMLSIGANNTFIPCGIPVDVSYDNWMLLKNIGRIGRVVAIEQDENPQ